MDKPTTEDVIDALRSEVKKLGVDLKALQDEYDTHSHYVTEYSVGGSSELYTGPPQQE